MPPTLDTTPRKQPRQERARATVDAILGAAAQVLVVEGYDRASTNRIAARAGVSIGTLYQYFPSKEALVAALAQRHSETMMALLGQTVQDLAGAPLELAVHTFVRAMLHVHAVEPELHRVLSEQVPRINGFAWLAEINRTAQALVQAYLQGHRERLRVQDLDTAAFLLVTTVEAVTHVAVLERPEAVGSQQLADELCALVLRYLVAEPRPD